MAVWQLVDRARDGDRDAFGQLYDRYQGNVYRYLYWRLSGNAALAEDLTADTFVRALRAIRSFTYQGKDPGAWFITIARNLLLDHVRSARARLEVTTGDMTLGREQAATGPGPEDAAVSTLTAAEAMRYVAELGPDQQECIVLRIFEGLSIAETAVVMGRTQGAVKALHHRAIRNLALRLPGGSK